MQVEWTPQATKAMRRLPANLRKRIVSKVEQYAADPSSLANVVTQLVGSDMSRMRIGSWRVIFRIENGDTVVILIVRPRGGAYD